MKTFIKLKYLVCLFLAFLHTSYSLNPDPSDICKSPVSHYDIQNLIQPPYWSFNIASGCSILTNSTDECFINVAFCKKFETLTGCTDSSACISYKEDSLIAGNYTKDPFTSIDKNKGFQADYPKGVLLTTKFGNSCFLKLSVKFVCNESFIWPTPFTGMPGTGPTPLSFQSVTNSSCDIVIEVPYSGACPGPLVPDVGLSSGSILLIIFSVGAGLYFGIGIGYNVITRRHFNIESLPNYEFWAEQLSFVKIGFNKTRGLCSSATQQSSRYEQI